MRQRFVAIFAAAATALAACTGVDENGGADNASTIGQTGGMCGGIAGFACAAAADYCNMPEGECVQIADAAGVCKKRPEICTQEYDPVCGCDGKTYSNACTAMANGTSVAAKGECDSPAAIEQ